MLNIYFGVDCATKADSTCLLAYFCFGAWLVNFVVEDSSPSFGASFQFFIDDPLCFLTK